MKVEFTKIDTSYAYWELSTELIHVALESISFVIRKYSKREDSRTLVIVLTCPCCNCDDKLDIENAILVSPFRGIDERGYNIKSVNFYPPFGKKRGDREAISLQDFFKHFEETIEEALK